MTDRGAFIARVRERIGTGLPESPIRPIPVVATDPISYTVDLTDPVAAFRRAADAAGAEVVDVPSGGLGRFVSGLAGDPDRARIAVDGDPVCNGVRAAVAGRLVDVDDIAAVAGADLGVTGVRAAVALTGSVIIDSSVPGARVCSLLPDTHVAVVAPKQIVATPGDVWRALDGPTRDPLPSNLVFVTGPSRSADIELTLTIGVHGPRRLVIALLED